MTLLLRAYIALILAVAGGGVSAADWSSQEFRLNVANAIFSQLRSAIRLKASEKVRTLDATVILAVLAEGQDEPISTLNSKGRRIAISDAFIAKSINLARIVRLNRDVSDQECAFEYKVHMEKTGSRLSPERFLMQPRPGCAAQMNRLPLGAMDEAVAEREFNATLVFAYLHELGHQYGNHQSISLPPNVDTRENRCAYLGAMAVHRKLEYEADKFAVDALAELGDSPLVLSLFSLWLSPKIDTEKIAMSPLFVERIAPHPLSTFRWVRILDRTITNMSRLDSVDPSFVQIIVEMKEWAARVEKFVTENDELFQPSDCSRL